MVRVGALQVVDVQRDQRVIDEALKKLVDELRVELADRAAGELRIQHQTRAAREIDHHARQRFIQRHIAVAVARQAALVAHRLLDRLADGNAHVFHRVVAVDVQIALALHIQIDQAVARDLVQHVVEKADAGGQLRLARAVKVEADFDLGLGGVARDFGGARLVRGGKGDGSGHSEASRAASICAFSSAVPTVRRTQLSSSGCILETFLIRTRRAFMPSNTFCASGTRTRIMLPWLG